MRCVWKRPVDLNLCTLWVLADKLLIPKLQNHILECMATRHTSSDLVPTMCINYVWEHTSPDNALRRWMLHLVAHVLSAKCLVEHPEQFPKDMLIELAALMIADATSGKSRRALQMPHLPNFHVPESQ